MQMIYLARLYRQTNDVRYRDAFRLAVEYLLNGQYENGGWPQFWPEMRGYQVHITFNDDAIVNTLEILHDIMTAEFPYDGDLTDKAMRQTACRKLLIRELNVFWHTDRNCMDSLRYGVSNTTGKP